VVVARRAVPIDAAAGANHGLAALAGAPGESHNGLELFIGVGRFAEVIGAQNRRQERRFVQGGKETRLRVPGEAVVHREVRFHFPGVLEKEPVLAFGDDLVVEIGWRLLRISDANAGENTAA
jgi:hypothetical protein